MTLIGLGVTTSAQGQREQGGQEDQKDAGQGRARGRGQQEPQRKEPTKQDQRRAEGEQQDLIRQHEQRLPQYREVLDQQQRVAEQRAAQLQQQKRNAQYRYGRRHKYGSVSNGKVAILAAVVAGIIVYELIRQRRP